MSPSARLRRRLCDLYGYEACVLVGRARAGLAALLDEIGGPLLAPATLCPAVVAAARAARVRMRLVPVSPRSGLATAQSFAERIASESGRGVAMPCHLYGLESEVAAFDGWFVLENDTLMTAISQAGRRRARGDAVLVSFGHAKTAEAGWGGALLTDDRALAGALGGRIERFPALGPEALAVEDDLCFIRRHARRLGRPDLAETLLDQDAAQVRHRLPDDAVDAIDAALDRVPAVIDHRRTRVDLWERALAGTEAELVPPPAPLIVPWRLIRRLRRPALRDPLVEALRRAGFDAGTNYPPLSPAFPAMLGADRDPESEEWGASVINLWLDERYDAARIEAAARLIKTVLDGDPT